jgi:uncharacterized RDD family membrane protein YckC
MIDVMQKSATPLPRTPSLFRRLASMLYDSLLLLALLFVAAFLFLGVTHDATSPQMKPIFQGYLLTVSAAYYCWFWLHGGQTLAMKTWRLRLVRYDGGSIGLLQAILRFVLALIGIAAAGAGLIWALFDRDRQFLHDRLAGTRIIRCD